MWRVKVSGKFHQKAMAPAFDSSIVDPDELLICLVLFINWQSLQMGWNCRKISACMTGWKLAECAAEAGPSDG